MPVIIYQSESELPTRDHKPEFWNIIDSDELKNVCLLNIMSELSEDVASMSNEQCRTVLARLQAYRNMMFSGQMIEATLNKEDIEED